MTTTTESQAPAADSFAALFEASVAKADALKEGDIVTGTVTCFYWTSQ